MKSESQPTRAAWVWGKRQWRRVWVSAAGFVIVMACAAIVVSPHTRVHTVPYTFYEAADGSLHRFPHTVDENDAKNLIRLGATMVYECACVEQQSDHGFWGKCVRHRHADVSVDVAPWFAVQPQLPKVIVFDRVLEVRRLVVDAMVEEGKFTYSTTDPKWVALGSSMFVTHRMSGLVINAITLVGLGIWLCFTPFVVRDLNRLRRIRHGRCAMCGYDLGGLPVGTSVCPECGSAVTLGEARGATLSASEE